MVLLHFKMGLWAMTVGPELNATLKTQIRPTVPYSDGRIVYPRKTLDDLFNS